MLWKKFECIFNMVPLKGTWKTRENGKSPQILEVSKWIRRTFFWDVCLQLYIWVKAYGMGSNVRGVKLTLIKAVRMAWRLLQDHCSLNLIFLREKSYINITTCIASSATTSWRHNLILIFECSASIELVCFLKMARSLSHYQVSERE